MRLDLLKPVIRANMRTANRRLQQYAKSEVNNPHLNSILEKIKGSPFYDTEKNKLKMGGLSKRDLETLAEVQKEIKSVDTVVYKYQYLDTTHKYMTHLITLNGGTAYLTDLENTTIAPYTSVSDLKKDLNQWLDKYKKDYKNYREDK